MSLSQIVIEEDLKRKLTLERDRLKLLGINWDVGDILPVVRPYLRKQ